MDSLRFYFEGGEFLESKKHPEVKSFMQLVKKVMAHPNFEYVMAKLYSIKIKPIGYPGYLLRCAMCPNYDPSSISDERVRDFVKDNMDWFKTIRETECLPKPDENTKLIGSWFSFRQMDWSRHFTELNSL
ncbi:MAG: hypothetical protein AB1295_05880 [Candidatus Micrarchaeota archaeon]